MRDVPTLFIADLPDFKSQNPEFRMAVPQEFGFRLQFPAFISPIPELPSGPSARDILSRPDSPAAHLKA